jgi:hypothetical protein
MRAALRRKNGRRFGFVGEKKSMIPAQERRFVKRNEVLVNQSPNVHVWNMDDFLDNDALLPEIWLTVSGCVKSSPISPYMIRKIRKLSVAIIAATQWGRS